MESIDAASMASAALAEGFEVEMGDRERRAVIERH